VLVTQNVPDPLALTVEALPFPVGVLANATAKGFGANHNTAFGHCSTPVFCVVNPDIRLESDPFPALLEALSSREIGVVGPLVRSPAGAVEDSARRFPTLASLGRKLFERKSGPDYPSHGPPMRVDWVAGMFMAFRSEAYGAVGGFDERFFLYYEDVDMCRRLRTRGLATVFHPGVSVIHDARRASRRDPRLMAIHAASAVRYLTRPYR
jgi:GT2 family glycosyltransferase